MKFLFNVLRVLPKPVLRIILYVFAFILFCAMPKRRKLTQNNIRLALGENYKKTTIKTFFYFSNMVSDNIKHLGDEKFIRKHIKITGLEHFNYAKSLNRGVIFTTAHFGNWEMMVCAFALLVEPVFVVVRPIDNGSVNRLVEEKRTSCGNKLLLTKNANAFNFLKILKKNGILGILTDQARRDDKMKIKFFGRDARVAEGMAAFAYRLDVPVLTAYMKEDKNGSEIVIEKPIFADKSLGFKDSAKKLMEDIHKRYENWIRKEPEKYLWMHNRWK